MTVILSTSCRSNQDDKEEKSTKPTRAEFLVSFLVDARGGSMTGCRSTQLRMLIPPRAAEQPVRITCRQLRSDNVLHLPPLNDGEGLASRILQLTPCQFLTPILLELRYSTQDTSDREIVIYRCDSGKKWTLHTNCGSDENLNAFMSTSVYDLSKINPSEDFKIQITTTSLPRYFALVCRPKQQIVELDVSGGTVHSTMSPGLTCTFPPKALTKAVSIGLSVLDARPGLLADLQTQGAAISPVFTIEPRRRKFHKPVTISLPVPQPKQVVSDDNGAPIEMTLMLLCSMCESGSRSVWENVTESTPLTRTNTGCIEFNTVVSAAFWLVHLPKWMVEDSIPMLDKLFRNICRVPYRASLAIFWRKEDNNQQRHSNENGNMDGDSETSEASVRVLVYTQEDRGHDPHCLETQEGYKLLVSSSDLVINHGTNLDISIKGNLYNLQESGARLRFQPYHENRCTMSVRRSLTSISAAGNINISSDEAVIYTASIVLPIKK